MSCERVSKKPKTTEGDSLANMEVEVAQTSGDTKASMQTTSWVRQISDASTAASEDVSSDEGGRTSVFDRMTKVAPSSGNIDLAKSGLPAPCTQPEVCQPDNFAGDPGTSHSRLLTAVFHSLTGEF
mmetsp:Transcript_85776/g.170281  ORF Transcript_85776/g.170281 Transcript_85776/m.170281 type:complete len:126 (-) Transcript_85776:115-492(-)